ncbi:MAG: glycosyltransferase [bacterium]
MKKYINLNKVRYSIVTPIRNEEKIITRTMNSVINQTIKPLKWVIIDDGSVDRTGQIIDSFAARYKWIEVIHSEKEIPSYEGIHKKLVVAFERIDLKANDFIGKLDADIELGIYYFEDLFREFNKDSKLGIAGGTLYTDINGKSKIENCPQDHVRGGLKLYRIQCWQDIGGMEFKLGYDTIDEIKASMFGWKIRSFEGILALHHRPTGQEKGVTIFGWLSSIVFDL